MVPNMTDDHHEPGEITERFRAFAESSDPAPSRGLPAVLIVGAVVVMVLAALAIIALTA
jgi:hypothetical protein